MAFAASTPSGFGSSGDGERGDFVSLVSTCALFFRESHAIHCLKDSASPAYKGIVACNRGRHPLSIAVRAYDTQRCTDLSMFRATVFQD